MVYGENTLLNKFFVVFLLQAADVYINIIIISKAHDERTNKL